MTVTTVVNVGADLLADAIEAQAVPVTRVDWRPPMEGTDADLAAVAADPRRAEANARALSAMLEVTATLVDVVPASEVLGLERGQFLHAGPPIEWARASGPRLWLYSTSLGAVMGLLFLLSWLAQSVAGTSAYNEQQLRQLQAPVSWAGYLTTPDFWNRTLQNWQSEFLAVASMVALSIYLRQRGSPESKPVGAPHSATSIEG